MKTTHIFKQITKRVSFCCGKRTALFFESEIPEGETQMSGHVQALAAALCAHAERERLPVAAAELEQLAGTGKGYAFRPHRVRFCALARAVRGKIVLRLSLLCERGRGECFSQEAVQIWSADGAYRLR